MRLRKQGSRKGYRKEPVSCLTRMRRPLEDTSRPRRSNGWRQSSGGTATKCSVTSAASARIIPGEPSYLAIGTDRIISTDYYTFISVVGEGRVGAGYLACIFLWDLRKCPKISTDLHARLYIPGVPPPNAARALLLSGGTSR
jgi:hypothetical protein